MLLDFIGGIASDLQKTNVTCNKLPYIILLHNRDNIIGTYFT